MIYCDKISLQASKQIISNSSKMKLPTNYSHINHLYISLNEYKQIINTKKEHWKYFKPLKKQKKQKDTRLVKRCDLQNVLTNHIYLIYTYKQDLTLNTLLWLI